MRREDWKSGLGGTPEKKESGGNLNEKIGSVLFFFFFLRKREEQNSWKC